MMDESFDKIQLDQIDRKRVNSQTTPEEQNGLVKKRKFIERNFDLQGNSEMATNLNKQWNSINKTLRKKVVKAKIPAQDEFDYEYDH